MATITLKELYNDIGNWEGNLLRADENTVVTVRNSTTLSYKYAASGVDFPSYQVVVTGTGFTYDGGIATGGDISSVQIKNNLGQTLLTFSGVGPSAVANDLSQFFVDAFGAPDYLNERGPWPNGWLALCHLMSGNDTIVGTSGNDGRTLTGFDAGNDLYKMGAGDDNIQGGVGRDTIQGGDGYDRLSYLHTTYDEGSLAFRGVTIDVDAGTAADPWGATDRFTGIEAFEGSRLNDRFIGSQTGRDEFLGGRGADFIDGGANSYKNGVLTKDDHDQVRYNNDYWDGAKHGIVVHLERSFVGGSIKGTIIDSFGNTDTVVDIERVMGTRFGDVFVGSRAENVFVGAEGKDSYDGGAGHDDAVAFWDNFADNGPHGVVVNLSLGSNQIIDDGFGNTETAVRIENLYGGYTDDRFTGSAASNWLDGGQGSDTMTGLGGSDNFYFDGDYILGNTPDEITDFVATGAAKEHLGFNAAGFSGMTTTLHLVNGNAATSSVGTFIFRAADHTLYWDHDGVGGDDKVAVVVLDGVNTLSSGNFSLF